MTYGFKSHLPHHITTWCLYKPVVIFLLLKQPGNLLTQGSRAVSFSAHLYTRRAKRYNVDNHFLNACKKKNMQWLETYAMAISMVGAMIFAVLITPVLL